MKTYKAKYKDLPEIIVDAESTNDAGRLAAKTYGDLGFFVDPFTIDIQIYKREQKQLRWKEVKIQEPIEEEEITVPIPLPGTVDFS